MRAASVVGALFVAACGGGAASSKGAATPANESTSAPEGGDLCGALKELIAAAPNYFQSILGTGGNEYETPTTVQLPGGTCLYSSVGGIDDVACDMQTSKDHAALAGAYADEKAQVERCVPDYAPDTDPQTQSPGHEELVGPTGVRVTISVDDDSTDGLSKIRVYVSVMNEDYEAPMD